MADYEQEVSYDPMDIDISDIDFDVVEDPETGAVSYDKPEPEDAEEADVWTPEPDVTDATSLIEGLDDEAIIAKLDDGRPLTKREAMELAQARDRIAHDREHISGTADRMRHAEKHLEAITNETKSDIEKNLKIIQDNIAHYKATKEYEKLGREEELRDKWMLKRSIIQEKYDNAKALIEAEKRDEFRDRVRQTDEAMIRKLGADTWRNIAQDTYDFVIGKGLKPETLEATLDPVMAEIFVMARKMAIIEQSQKAKAQQEIKATIARSKQSSITNQRREEVPSRNSAAQQKVMAGSTSRDDLAMAFDPNW